MRTDVSLAGFPPSAISVKESFVFIFVVWIYSDASLSFTEWSKSHETSNQHLIQWIAKTLGQNSTSSWPPRPWVPILVVMWCDLFRSYDGAEPTKEILERDFVGNDFLFHSGAKEWPSYEPNSSNWLKVEVPGRVGNLQCWFGKGKQVKAPSEWKPVPHRIVKDTLCTVENVSCLLLLLISATKKSADVPSSMCLSNPFFTTQ